jgi:ribosomal protein L11 methyltransferase
MKYFEADFTIFPYSPDAIDLLADVAGEAGFESFEVTSTGLKGYVQQQLFNRVALDMGIAAFPIDCVDITYDIHEAEDRDWNEQWEQEGFEPLIVESEKLKCEKCSTIIIHDGRHLPDPSLLAHNSPFLIEIDARQAFGTGTHETTRMICSTLLELKGLAGTRVLDCGTGTGILSICALKLGANEAIGYDIDEWSVDNARHNAVINQVDNHFQSLLGDASILNKVEGKFNIVLANINRNILFSDLPSFHKKMSAGAILILSGFYTSDSPMLISRAEALGLTLKQQKEDHDWACLVFYL